MARVWEISSVNGHEALSVTLGGAAASPSTGQRIAALQSSTGHYYFANGDGTGIRLRRADGPTPRIVFGTWQLDTHATTGGGDTNPALTEDHRGFIHLFFESSTTVYRTDSGNRGVNWSAPVSQLPGILPAATVGAVHKQEVAVAVQADNSLLGTVRYPGDRWPNDNYTGSTEATSSDAPYVLVDDAGSPLVTDGTGVALSNPADGRIVMALRYGSDTDLSHWISGDKKAIHWRRVA